MHESNNRHLKLNSPLLANHHRSSLQENATKKLKVHPSNGVKPTSETGRSNAAFALFFSFFSSIRSDPTLRCPLRQTLPIFKQPVTHYPADRDEVKAQIAKGNASTEGKPSEKTKPRQLFWEKRFEKIRASDIDQQPLQNFQLPEQIKGKLEQQRNCSLLDDNETTLEPFSSIFLESCWQCAFLISDEVPVSKADHQTRDGFSIFLLLLPF
jgi:hypothetical protein